MKAASSGVTVVFEAAALFHSTITAARAFALLHRLDGREKATSLEILS